VGGGIPTECPQGMPQAGERHHPVMNATVLAEAAAKLGVTQQQMEEAMNVTAGGPPDLSAAAENLGVTREELIEALSSPGWPRATGRSQLHHVSPSPGDQELTRTPPLLRSSPFFHKHCEGVVGRPDPFLWGWACSPVLTGLHSP